MVASVTGYQNQNVPPADVPPTNDTGNTPGPLNGDLYVPYTAPNTNAVGAGGGPVFIGPGLNTNLTAANAPAPVNLTAQGKTVPGNMPIPTAAAAQTSQTSTAPKSAAVRRDAITGGAAVLSALIFGAVVGGVMVLV